MELGGAEDVLEGFAGPSAFDRVAQRDAFGLGQGAVELEVEFHAFEAEGVREQVLGIEARVFHAAVGEVALAGAENLEEREGVRHGQGQRAAGTSGPWLKKLFSEWRPDQPFGPCSEIFCTAAYARPASAKRSSMSRCCRAPTISSRSPSITWSRL